MVERMSVLADVPAAGARVMSQLYEYAIGVDLGQKQDHTAVAVIEKVRTQFTSAIRSRRILWRGWIAGR